jgi:hypothetical protein
VQLLYQNISHCEFLGAVFQPVVSVCSIGVVEAYAGTTDATAAVVVVGVGVAGVART